MIEYESNIRIEFSAGLISLKFDGTEFYTRAFNAQPGCKGVDFLAWSERMFVFLEVKNCLGEENNCRWRTEVNNQKRDTSPTAYCVEDRDSLDIEMAKKVAMTIAALVGAYTRPRPEYITTACIDAAKGLLNESVHSRNKTLVAVLLVEGEFSNGVETRTTEMILSRLQVSLTKKLKWLNCTILVTNTQQLNQSGLPLRAMLAAQ